jgi:hypothetical protein
MKRASKKVGITHLGGYGKDGTIIMQGKTRKNNDHEKPRKGDYCGYIELGKGLIA